MDLTLSLKYQEQNDNKAIILTDTTINYNSISNTTTTEVVIGSVYQIAVAGTYNFIGLGAVNNDVGTRFISNATATINLGGTVYDVTPTITEITGATLNISVTNLENTVIVKDQIDLYSQFTGPWTSQSEMVYTITAALMGDSADSLLVDGLYALNYTIISEINGEERTDTLSVTILVYGQVKVATYQKLRQIPTLYVCSEGLVKKTISEADLCGAFLTGIENSAYIAKTEELINMLVELNNIVKNGSNITW